MPELELPVLRNDLVAANEQQTAGERLRETLWDGITMGVEHRLSSPGDLLTTAGVAAAGGGALRLMMNAGGKWGTAAKVATGLFAVGMAADVTRRAVPTISALADSYNSGLNMESNKLAVANNLGTALVDYPLATLAGYGGWAAAGRIMPAHSFTYIPESRHNIKDPVQAATRAAIERSLPITPETRAAAQANANLPPSQRLDAMRAALEKAPVGQPIKFENPNAAGVFNNPRPNLDVRFPAEIGRININPRLEGLNFQTISVQRSLMMPLVAPVDLLSDAEQVQLVKGGLKFAPPPEPPQARLLDQIRPFKPQPAPELPQAQIQQIEQMHFHVPPAQMQEWMHNNPEAARILRELKKEK